MKLYIVPPCEENGIHNQKCIECNGIGWFECKGRIDLECDKIKLTHFHFCYCEENQTDSNQTSQET